MKYFSEIVTATRTILFNTDYLWLFLFLVPASFALFGFLGFGTLIFLIQNRWYIVVGASILLLASIYFSSKRVNSDCDDCEVK